MQKLKFRIDQFTEAVRSVFGVVKQNKAGQRRLETPIVAHGDSFNTAMQAAFARQIRHNMLGSYRRNSHGLPLGIGPTQYEAARKMEARMANRDPNDEKTVSETLLNSADETLDAVKKNREMRAKHPRACKLARRHCHAAMRTPPLKEWLARHTAKLQETRRQGRVPYTRATEISA